MSTADPRFRRNFVVASILHVVLIGGVILWESFFSDSTRAAFASVQLVTPADILGDLPTGEGHGRGAYKAPPPGANMVAVPNEAMISSDESVAPLPRPAANEIAIPKKTATKKPTTTKTRTEPKAKKATTTARAKPTTSLKPKPTAVASGPSADEIRQRFAKALRNEGDGKDGTPYGDNKPAGGGSGKSGRIGSPDGSPNGIAGGVGQGSPFWDYYQHVHDQMYQAWEQPGQLIDNRLVATVIIQVARDGTITNVTLKNSSGSKLMDDSAVTAARNVQRLEPPPDALVKGATANITVDFQVEG
jgi:TonB family protein